MLAALALLLATGAAPPAVAITIDDGPDTRATPLLSPEERNAAMLKALTDRGIRAGLFVTVGNGADKPQGLALLQAWSQAGMLIGNHTVTHPDLEADSETLAAYEKELLDCDAVIHNFAGYQKLFRFPYLHEGKHLPAKLDGFRAFLKEQGYRNAYVTIDTSDWRIGMQLAKKLKENPKLDLSPYRKIYLAHVKERAESYQELSRRLLGRDLPQVLLIHHNLINALFLGDVLDQFKRMGWNIIDPALAYADPVYQTEPPEAAAGHSLLNAIARSRGFDLRPYERLFDDAQFEIDALEKQGL